MTKLETNQLRRACRPERPRALFVGVVVLAGIFLIAGCGDDDDSDQADPAAVLTDYLEVWNAEDAEAVMVFYAEDAVIEGHPEDTDELATGKSEILVIETGMQGHQGSTGTMEYINMEISGDTVAFDSIFHNSQGACFSTGGSVATINNDVITLIDWGDTDVDLC